MEFLKSNNCILLSAAFVILSLTAWRRLCLWSPFIDCPYSSQYPHLFANWKVVYTEAKIDGSREVHKDGKYYQPLHVLEKPGIGVQ